MTIQQAIKKSIEGGYSYKGDKLWHFSDTDEFRIHPNGGITIPVSIDSILLDPAFWQCLGKAMGWPEKPNGKGLTGDRLFVTHWRYQWHIFIDHLAEGGTIATYFGKLN